MDEFLNAEETAELLRIPLSTLYVLTSRKELPHNKVGKRLVFSRSKLLEWFEESRILTQKEMEEQAREHMFANKKAALRKNRRTA